MQDFHDLKVWQKSHALAREVYAMTKSFPREEIYGLTSQMRRAAVSVAANIAEGSGRRTGADFARFLSMAMGSASEFEYYALLAHDLELLDEAGHRGLADRATEIKRMLTSLSKKLTTDN